MSFNDYIACSNNSINDNKVNAKKAKSTIYQLRKIIKPLLALLKKNQISKNSYKSQPQPEFYQDEYSSSEMDENIANEILENQIFEDIDACEEYSGVQVYNDGHMEVLPVCRGQRFVPVNFARTDAGTFFWTSNVGPDCDIDSHGDDNAITNYQQAELQAVSCDRWAQA